ncbi:hypothetical protein GOC23_31040 [Sinorhizobium meliloti]|nr:hypothetical protein [Sinorhizobium meliloti]
MILGIKAPKATQVKATSTPLESDVEIGDVLIELHDFEEVRILSQIDRAIEENRIKKLKQKAVLCKRKSRLSGKYGTIAQLRWRHPKLRTRA